MLVIIETTKYEPSVNMQRLVPYRNEGKVNMSDVRTLRFSPYRQTPATHHVFHQCLLAADHLYGHAR